MEVINTWTWGYVVWRLRFRVDRRLSRFQESWLVPLFRPKREERGRNLTDGLTELGPADNGSPDRKTIKGDGEREGRREGPTVKDYGWPRLRIERFNV